MVIKTNGRGRGKKYGLRKYAEVDSLSHSDIKYIVTKTRVWGKKYYKYSCTCPDFMYRVHPCKHIELFKDDEKNDLEIVIKANGDREWL